MVDYLLQHNVTMFDFWILLELFVVGTALLVRFFGYFILYYVKEKSPIGPDDIAMGLLALFVTGVVGTYLLMGAVHFIRMVIYLFG